MPWNYSILDFTLETGMFLLNNNLCGSSRFVPFMCNLKMKNSEVLELVEVFE